jgi:hypothetical protein
MIESGEKRDHDGGGSPNDGDGGRIIETMVALARRTYTDELSPRENDGLVRLEATWQRSRSPGRTPVWRRAPVLATALALAVLLPGAYLMHGRQARLTYQVANGVLEPDGEIRQTRPGTVVLFSEGSQIALQATTRARVASTTSDGGRVVLEDGRLDLDIVHRSNGRWSVEAGPYTIRVTGTAFDVRWSADADRLDCRMKRGSVVVSGPLFPTGVTLTAGMRLEASPRTGQHRIDGEGASAGTATLGLQEPEAARIAPDTDPALDETQPSRQRATALAAPSPSRRALSRRAGALGSAIGSDRSLDGEASWTRRLASGQFDAIMADAEGQGLARVLQRASAADLAALADAARYTRHTAISRRALLALRSRFPQSAESGDTAFFLGGLAENAGSARGMTASIEWYEQYLRESPAGRFVDEALGRNVVLTHTLRGAGAARPLAEDYLRRFPRGPYAATARKVLQSSP